MRFKELKNQHHNSLEVKTQSFTEEHKKLNDLFTVEVFNEFNNNNRLLKLRLNQLACMLKKQPK